MLRILLFMYYLVRLVGELGVLSLVIAFGAQCLINGSLLSHWGYVYGISITFLSPLMITHAYEMLNVDKLDPEKRWAIDWFKDLATFLLLGAIFLTVLYIRT